MNTSLSHLVDLEAILTPCSDDMPSGYDTRLDTTPSSPYFTLKDLRHQARALERKNIIEDEPQYPEQWRQLAQQIPPILQTQSKDIEITTWLIEALCREQGFAGLATGFRAAREIIAAYWHSIHPLPDNDGQSARISSLIGLNGFDNDGTLIQPILAIPIIFSDATGYFATWQCEQSSEIARLDKTRAEKKIQSGSTSPELVQRASREMTDSDLLQMQADIDSALEEFNLLATTLDQLTEVEQPSTRLMQTLERCKDALLYLAGDRLQKLNTNPASSDIDMAHAESTHTIGSQASTTTNVAETIQQREAAVERLRQLASFFRRTEPHSPLSYLIDQAVRWSQLSLPELMLELIDDSSARNQFHRLTGIPTET